MLNSPPLTWIVHERALWNGYTPGIEPVHERTERKKIEATVAGNL